MRRPLVASNDRVPGEKSALSVGTVPYPLMFCAIVGTISYTGSVDPLPINTVKFFIGVERVGMFAEGME